MSKLTMTMLLVCGLGAVASAEENLVAKSGPPHLYRVDLNLLESSDGKKVGIHSYSMVVTDRDSGSIRMGSNLPFSAAAGSVTRHDVGTFINCNVNEQEGVILLRTSFEVSELTSAAASDPKLGPVTHKLSFATTSVTTSGKPATVGAAEDQVSKRRYQLDVTATRLK